MKIAVIVPCRDEEGSVADVVWRCLAVVGAAGRVVVVDNGSRDRTAGVAAAAGATVVGCDQRGYGYAARAGTDAAPGVDVYVYLDGDGSMAPEDIPRLLAPIAAAEADVVCGRRREARTSMPWHQVVGNRVIAAMLRRHGIALRELGPYRAVRASVLDALDLPGSRYAWPAELLVRARGAGARIAEVDVGYSERTAGHSKVGGSVRGSVDATWDIASVLLRRRLARPAPVRAG